MNDITVGEWLLAVAAVLWVAQWLCDWFDLI